MSNLHPTASPMQPPDPREQSVLDPFRATPESIARAKASAAEERAEVDAVLGARNVLRDDAKLRLLQLVDDWGWHTVNLWMQGIRASTRRDQ